MPTSPCWSIRPTTPAVLAEIDDAGDTSIDTRSRLAAKAFAHTARYDTMVASYLQQRLGVRGRRLRRAAGAVLRQAAGPALRREPAPARRVLPQPARSAAARSPPRRVLQGKELSYNNIADADAAIECVRAVRSSPPASSSSTPIPAASRSPPMPLEAYAGAYRTDPTSAFGGIIAFNRELDAATARAIIERQFAEVIAAPSVSAEALAALAAKPNLRVLATGDCSTPTPAMSWNFARVTGGLLLQQRDSGARRSGRSEGRQPPPARRARARRPAVRLAGGASS